MHVILFEQCWKGTTGQFLVEITTHNNLITCCQPSFKVSFQVFDSTTNAPYFDDFRWSAYNTREERLEIMKDSRIGAFGTITLVITLGARAALLALVGWWNTRWPKGAPATQPVLTKAAPMAVAAADAQVYMDARVNDVVTPPSPPAPPAPSPR